MKTKYKILIAKYIIKILSLFNFKLKRVIKKKNIYWNLDLSEGIELSIYIFGTFEPSIIKMSKNLKLYGNFDIIDIGANIGSHTLNFAKEFLNSKVYAVEPSTYSFNKLQSNLALNKDLSKRIDITQAFITNKETKPEEVYSSWNLNSNEQKHFEHFGIKKETTNARTISLDNFILEKKINNKSFIKCDVDGFELEVFKSGLNYLSNYRPPIIMELAPYLYRENGYESEDLINLLSSFGYEFYFGKNLKKISGIYNYAKNIKKGSKTDIVLL